ncbi:WD_REPEATS_REGION domain-containing protein [Linnemannia gamsii]|uniref:WD_REPEATS_REGION domain-containing protein n=1 Tax=Linnemannia gamsii TaxID=64522 RepID=A0ABQ7KCQ6_9FUNG|nr:WD_REPEATS_REGION domain-containing protein [Linnemannia gamsii]
MSSSAAGNTRHHNARFKIKSLSAGIKNVFRVDRKSKDAALAPPAVSCASISGMADIPDVTRLVLPTTFLPKHYARIDQTSQLAYCCSLIARSHNALVADLPTTPSLKNNEQNWVQETGRIERDQLHWLVDQLIKAFSDDTLKESDVVAEIVLLGPVLDSDTYRCLLSCFITKFENTTPLDVNLLQGLIQLIECASIGYLADSDLVRIAAVLSKELTATHNGTSDHASHLMWALSRVLDIMVAGKVKDLNRERDHQLMLQLLAGLKDSKSTYIRNQAEYAYQALQYASDDETPLQVVLRYAQGDALVASAATSVFKLDRLQLVDGLARISQICGNTLEASKTGIEGTKTFVEVQEGFTSFAKRNYNSPEKHSWYLTLQVTAGMIQQGRLAAFNDLVWSAPCRHDYNFQWGVCRQIAEIAVDPLWDAEIGKQAIAFLGELYRKNTQWKPHEDIQRWIVALLVHISSLSDPYIVHRAEILLQKLNSNGVKKVTGSFPLKLRLPLPRSCPLLVQVQDIPKVEYDLHKLRSLRIDEYTQSVYIAPMAKLSLQASEDNLFPLMDKVKEFLTSERQVMLILGDSGAGKSSFNRHLENELWKTYETGGPIPLFVNLPALEHPDRDLIAEQLRLFNFFEIQVQELKQHRQLVLICDGYDESQLMTNLHNTNFLNRPGKGSAKLLVTCRTQYLGPDYHYRFVPEAVGQYYGSAKHLFQEAVLAPFTKNQIEQYVDEYVQLEQRIWAKEDYMLKLMTIPHLMDLVKNPFLLTLALETLPIVVKGRADLSKLRLTRIQLFDTFVEHWLEVNKHRLLRQRLSETKHVMLNNMLANGFERDGISFQKQLAAAIFREQDGIPVVHYSPVKDKTSWKEEFFSSEPKATFHRDSSLLTRAGNYYRFAHRSLLEYFYSRVIWDPSSNIDEFAPQHYFDSTGAPLPITEHPLSSRSLVREASVIQFLAERVQVSSTSALKYHLLALIGLSMWDPQASQAAANAIMILVRAGVRFHGTDLRGIRISGADLTGGRFDSALLQRADLTRVNFSKTWIRQVDFSGALMSGTRFGEMPYLTIPDVACSCAFLPDGGRLAVGSDKGHIDIYDTATWELVDVLESHQDRVTSLAFSVCGDQMVSGCWDGTVLLWYRRSNYFFVDCILKGHSDHVTDVAYSSAVTQVASASADKSVRLWDARDGSVLFVLRGHTLWVRGVAYSPDGEHVVSCSHDDTIRIFNTRTGEPALVSDTKGGMLQCIAYSPDGQRIVSGDAQGTLQLWDAALLEMVVEWKGHARPISSVAFSPDSLGIVSCSGDRAVKLWDSQTGALVSDFRGHSGVVVGNVFSPDGSRIASASEDKTVRFWEVNFCESAASDSVVEPLNSVAFSSDGQYLVSGDRSGMLRRYKAGNDDPDLTFSCKFRRAQFIAYSPGAHQIATGGFGHDVILWSVPPSPSPAQVVLTGHTAHVKVVLFSPCGNWIASGADDHTVRLWDSQTGQLSLVLSGHTNSISSVAFAPSGHEIASGDEDGEVRTWDMSTGNLKAVLRSSRDGRCVVGYIPGSDDIVSAHKDGDVLKWVLCDEDFSKGVVCDRYNSRFQNTIIITGVGISHFAISSCGQWIITSSHQSLRLLRFTSSEVQEDWKEVALIKDFFGRIAGIAWKPGKLEFVTACEDGSMRIWSIVEEPDKVLVVMVWDTGLSGFVASEAVLFDTVGLDATDQSLLKQRGAVGVLGTSYDIVGTSRDNIRTLRDTVGTLCFPVRKSHDLVDPAPEANAFSDYIKSMHRTASIISSVISPPEANASSDDSNSMYSTDSFAGFSSNCSYGSRPHRKYY